MGDYYAIFILISGASESLDDAFTKSKSPHDGHCNISPNNGTSLETTFKISCQDWKSSVSSLNYHVWLHKEANEDQLLSYGSVPEFHLLLPAGDESTHYMVNISVEIIDLHEASDKFSILCPGTIKFLLNEIVMPNLRGLHCITCYWKDSSAKSFYLALLL